MQLVLLGETFEAEDIARRLLADGNEIYLDSKDTSLLKRLEYIGKVVQMDSKEGLARLSEPRVIWSAELIGKHLTALATHLPAGTILVNSRTQYFEDNIRLNSELASSGVRYIDVGAVSDGYRLALFVGGDQTAFQDVEPLLAALAGNGSYYHCGPAGSGHFLRCIQQKYEVLVQSALTSILAEIRRSPFSEGVSLEAVLIFGHLFHKKQRLPESVWHFLRSQMFGQISNTARGAD